MAISYSLAMATPLRAAAVAAELHAVAKAGGLFDGDFGPEDLIGDGVLTRFGTWVRVVDAEPAPWGDPETEDLGFTPTVRVVFRLNNSADTSAQDDDMIRLVSGLLDKVPGDAVLHFEYEYIWLVRQGGELSLSERTDIWPPRRLAAVRQPYQRATYTFS